MTLDAIANVAATCTSAIVAGVALVFSYRQNHGWAPIAFVEEHILCGVSSTGGFRAGLNLEIWNRRKYPVVVNAVDIRASGIELIDSIESGQRDLICTPRYAWMKLTEPINPSDRIWQVLNFNFHSEDPQSLRASFKIRIEYFDPVRNKKDEIEIEHKYMEHALGWNKETGDEQRRLYADIIEQAREEAMQRS